MTEKHIILEDIDPMVFYGVGNSHLQMLKALFPKLRIVARDNVLRVLGDEEQMGTFEEQVEVMRKHVLKYNRITEEDILEIKLQSYARNLLKEKIEDQKVRKEYLENILNNEDIKYCLKENKLDEAKGLAEELINSNLS